MSKQGPQDFMERYERQAFDGTLYELAKQEGYSHGITSDGGYLKWGKATVEDPEIFEDLFPLPGFSRKSRDTTYPSLPWLSSQFLVRENGNPIIVSGEGHIAEVKKRYQRLRNHIGNGAGQMHPETIAHLTAWRDGLEKQLRRIYELLLDPLKETRSVLQVWYVQAARSLSRMERDATSKEGADTLSRLYHDATELWRTVVQGAPSSLLESFLAESLPRKGLVEGLAGAQQRGVLYYAEKCEPLFQKARPFNAQREALELILKRALINEQLMVIGEVDAELARELYGVAYDHTMEIGELLFKRWKDHGQYPGEGQWNKGDFKKWAAEVAGVSETSVYDALSKTGCWVNPKQGDSSGVKKIMENAEAFYLRFADEKSEK